MTTRTTLFVASLALALAAPTAAFAQTHPGATTGTSIGTSQARTAGGRNIVNLSVLRGSSVGAAKAITGAMYNRPVIYRNGNQYYQSTTDLKSMLQNGYKIPHSLPAPLAAEADHMEVRPWAANEPHVLTNHVANSVATRLTTQANTLQANASRLHTKGEITDAHLAHANEIAGYWKQVATHFAEAAKPLEPGKYARTGLAVELDK